MTVVAPPREEVRGGSPFNRESRLAALPGILRERIMVLDGAMGTMLQTYRFGEADFRGDRFRDHPRDLRGDSDLLCLTQPAAVTAIHAGYLTAGLAVLGSCSRPIGGLIADRLGGDRVLSVLLIAIALAYGVEAQQPELSAMVGALGVSMTCLGLGNGAVFQLVPQRFQRELGAATGVIGAIGGVGGFVLPTLLGGVRQYTGGFGYGFAVLCAVAATGAVCLRRLTSRRGRWHEVTLAAQRM